MGHPDKEIHRLRIIMRQVARAGAIDSTELTVDCPRTAQRVFIDRCIYCGSSEGMVLDPTGEDSFVRCNVECDGEAPRTLPVANDRSSATEVPVSEVMTKDVVCVTPSTSVEALAGHFVQEHISGVPVVDPEQGLVGIVSQTDLVRHRHEGGEEPARAPIERKDAEAAGVDRFGYTSTANSGAMVQDLMSPVVFAVPETASIATVAALMAQEHIHRLPVISADGRQLAGIVSSLDILGWLARCEQLVNGRWG